MPTKKVAKSPDDPPVTAATRIRQWAPTAQLHITSISQRRPHGRHNPTTYTPRSTGGNSYNNQLTAEANVRRLGRPWGVQLTYRPRFWWFTIISSSSLWGTGWAGTIYVIVMHNNGNIIIKVKVIHNINDSFVITINSMAMYAIFIQ